MSPPSKPAQLRQQVAHDGFAIVESVLNSEAVDELIVGLESWQATAPPEAAANLRNLTDTIPQVARLCSLPSILQLAGEVFDAEAFVVRSLFFDKTPGANWKVAWHQDLTIAVRAKCDVPGFGPWSVKAGVPHVQPPVRLLERMATLRIHLDDCDARNGALKVMPGSHREGKLTHAAIQEWRTRVSPITCAIARGGAMLMRPLLLHASAPAEQPTHRRVIHLEFAAEALPRGLQWAGAP